LRVLAVIPARGGSKGLPRKNLLQLCGVPLIGWTVRQAAAARLLTRCIVSTDDEEIASTARLMGADVPFIRPFAFAKDDSPASDVVLHALETLAASGESYDAIAWLEPTSPLRNGHDIDSAVSLLASRRDADAVISVAEVHLEHPRIVKRIENGRLKPFTPTDDSPVVRRQQLEPAFFPYGVIYLARVDAYRAHRTFYTEHALPYPIERWQAYEIDDADDLAVCETMMRRHMRVEARLGT